MKFVCDGCKAKYQIGDDKVAGRTLRMKCRRCGHMIQVSATVTESSVSQNLPAESVTGSATSPVRATPPPRSPVEAVPPRPSPMAPLETEPSDDGATVVRPSPLLMAEVARAHAGQPPRPPARSNPAIQPRIVPPAAASMRGSNPPPRPSQAPSAPDASLGIAGAGQHSPSAPGLYDGFQRAVASPGRAESVQQLPTEDWYVGVGGVPLGPVRLSVLRDKAAANQIDGDSLVWREGFDEWQPIKNFPALMALVDESKQMRASRTNMPAVGALIARSSAVPAPAASYASPGMGGATPAPEPSLPFNLVRSSQTPAPGVAGAGVAGAGVAGAGVAGAGVAGAGVAGAGVAGAGVAASASAGMASGLGAAAGTPAAGTPAAGTPAAGTPAAGTPAAGPGSSAPGTGYGLTTTAGVSAPSSASGPAPTPGVSISPRFSEPPPSLAPAKKRGVPPMAWALVAMAAAFGGVAAWAVFLRDGGTKIVYLESTSQPGTEGVQGGAAPPAPPSPTATSEAGADPAATAAANATGGGVRVASQGGATAKPGDPTAPIDRTGFGATPSGPAAEATGTGSGGRLSEGEINGVVSRNKPMITRRCWTPAYDARSSNAPSSAKVSVSLTVGPSGSVQGASASGSESTYPGLASCVAGSVKAWQFPPSDEGAKINIPFGFSGQ